MKNKIIIYSTPTCPYCYKVKDWLKEHNLDFEDINVAENHEAAKDMIEKSGQRGVPVIDINGKIVIGFDIDKLKELLKIKQFRHPSNTILKT